MALFPLWAIKPRATDILRLSSTLFAASARHTWARLFVRPRRGRDIRKRCRGDHASATPDTRKATKLTQLAPTAITYRDQVIWHVEDALCTTVGDRLVEKPEFIPFPSEPTRREIAAFSVIVARRGVPQEHLCRLTTDNMPKSIWVG